MFYMCRHAILSPPQVNTTIEVHTHKKEVLGRDGLYSPN